MSDEEVAYKLRLLKRYSRDYDVYEAQWKVSHGNRDAYLAMTQAESKYVALSEWLWAQGIAVWWDGKQQEYYVLSTVHDESPTP